MHVFQRIPDNHPLTLAPDNAPLPNQKQRVQYEYELENQVGELALVCRTMMTILRKNGVIDPAELEQVMNEIDAEDGTIDGKSTEPPSEEPPEAPEIRAW